MKGRLGAADVLSALERVVARDPDRVDDYGTTHVPRYVVHGAPNCFAAVVLHELGCGIGVLKALDRERGDGDDRRLHGSVLDASRHLWLRSRLTPGARALLTAVQAHQDRGLSWGDSLGAAMGPAIHWLDRRRYEERPWMSELKNHRA